MSETPRSMFSFPSQVEIAGIAAALIPFICNITTTSTRTVNGRVVEETSTDYVAIVLGLIAVGIAAYIAVSLLPGTDSEDRPKRLAVIAAIAVIGAYQLLARGLGMV